MATNIIVPKFKEGEELPAWVDRSLRNGGFLHELMRREKQATQARLVHSAQPYRNYERRKGSEFNLLSTMDLTTFLRWQQTDEGIVNDPKAFKKLVKDNPAMTPWRR